MRVRVQGGGIRLVGWLCLVVVLFGLSAPAADGPPAHLRAKQTKHGYLTLAKEAKIEREGDSPISVMVPAPEKVDFAWSDQPFVVQMPFDLDVPVGQEGRVHVWLGFEGLSTNMWGKPDVLPVAQLGLLCPEGKALPAGVRVRNHRSDEFKQAAFEDADGTACVLLGNLGAIRDGAQADEGIWRETEKSGPFRDGIYLTFDVSPDALRGTYVIWLTIHGGNVFNFGSGKPPDPATVPNEMVGRVRASLYAVQGKDGENDPFPDTAARFAVGYEGADTEVRPYLSRWKRLPDVEADVRLKRNGWVFESSRVASIADQKAAVGTAQPDPTNSYTGAAQGLTMTASHERNDASRRESRAYVVNLPREIPDYSIFDIQASCTFSASVSADATALDTNWVYWGVEIGRPFMTWIWAKELGIDEGLIDRSREAGDRFTQVAWPVRPAELERYNKDQAETFEHWNPVWAPYRLPPTVWPVGPEGGAWSGVFRFYWGRTGKIEKGKEYALYQVEMRDTALGWAFYRRRSDRESQALGPAAPPGPSAPAVYRDDGFWPWYEKEFCPLSKDVTLAMHKAESSAALFGLSVAECEKRARVLEDALKTQDDFEERGWLTRAADWFGDKPVVVSDEVRAEMRRKAEGLRAEIKESHGEVEMLASGLDKEMGKLLDSLGKQEERTTKAGASRPDLAKWRKFWERHRAITPASIHLRGGNPEGWEAAMAGQDMEILDADLRNELGKMYLQQGHPAKALCAWRRAARVAGDSAEGAEARALAASVEAGLLRAIAGRMSGEVEKARGRFFGYLKERLGSESDLSGVSGTFEHVWQVLTTGLGAVASDAVGRTVGMEEEMGNVQDTATLAWLGLKAMAALAERGTTLEEMKAGLDVTQLRRRLALRRVTGVFYSDKDYRGLGTGITGALALPEVVALLAESEELLTAAMGACHFDLDDVSLAEIRSDRLEYAFDITSAKNVAVLLLPHSVGTIGGKFVPLSLRPWSGSAWAKELAWAAETGQKIRTGQEVVATMVGWERALELLSKTRAFGRIAGQLERMHQSGGIVWKVTWGTSPFIADLVLATGVTHLAEKYGGPRIGAAVDAIMSTFLFDPDLCARLLENAGATKTQVRGLIKAFGDQVDIYHVDLKESEDLTKLMEEVLREARRFDGEPMLKRGLPDLFIPGLDDLNNQRYALDKALKSMGSGAMDEARHSNSAAAKLLEGAKEQGEKLKTRQLAANEVGEKLPDSLDTKQLKPGGPDGQKPDTKQLKPGDPDARVPDVPGGSGVPKPRINGTYDNLLAEGNAKIALTDPDGAIDYFEAAAQAAETASDKAAALRKLEIAREMAAARKSLPKPPPVARFKPIEPDAHRMALDPNAPRSIVKEEMKELPDFSSGHGDPYVRVFKVEAPGGPYAVKHVYTHVDYRDMAISRDEKSVLDSLEAEVAISYVADLFGVRAPACRARVVRDAQGKFVCGEVVSRWVDGSDLTSFGTGQCLALKEQFVEQRLFGMITGDYDRHLGNLKYNSQSGELVGIDFGQGNLWADGKDGDTVLGWARDHWCERARKFKYETMNVMEHSLHYMEFKPALDRAKAVFREKEGEMRARLREAMRQVHVEGRGLRPAGEIEEALRTARADGNADAVAKLERELTVLQDAERRAEEAANKAFDVMRDRVDNKMDDLLKGLNDRNHVPLSPTASIRGPGRTRVHACRAPTRRRWLGCGGDAAWALAA